MSKTVDTKGIFENVFEGLTAWGTSVIYPEDKLDISVEAKRAMLLVKLEHHTRILLETQYELDKLP